MPRPASGAPGAPGSRQLGNQVAAGWPWSGAGPRGLTPFSWRSDTHARSALSKGVTVTFHARTASTRPPPGSRGIAVLTSARAPRCVKLALTPTRVPLAGLWVRSRGAAGPAGAWSLGVQEEGAEAVAGPVPQPQDGGPTWPPAAAG